VFALVIIVLLVYFLNSMTGRNILKQFSEPLVIEGGGDAVIIKVGSACIGFNRRILFHVTSGWRDLTLPMTASLRRGPVLNKVQQLQGSHSSVTVLVEALRYATYSVVYFRIANSRVIKHLRNVAKATCLCQEGKSCFAFVPAYMGTSGTGIRNCNKDLIKFLGWISGYSKEICSWEK
jgi:hypothetical protein